MSEKKPLFRLEPNPTFWAPVEIHVPGQGKGRIEVEYRYPDASARKAWVDSLPGRTNHEALSDIVTNWREIDAPFSPENLQRLLDHYATAATALFEAYFAELAGAAEKNSGRPSATG